MYAFVASLALFFLLQRHRRAGDGFHADHNDSRLAPSPAVVGRSCKEDMSFKDDMQEGHVEV